MAEILTFLAQGFILGLSLGIGCLATCSLVYGPALASQKGSWRQGLAAVILFSAGRFLSYATFGMMAGFGGRAFSDLSLVKHLLVISSYFLLSFYLLATAFIRLRSLQPGCPLRKYERYAGRPFVFGILTGINICPPFLLAVARGFESGPWGGLLLFVGFFFSTSIYLLPIAAFSLLSQWQWYRLIGMAASALVAGWFLFLACRLTYYLVLAYW